jgi:hypothetical protein
MKFFISILVFIILSISLIGYKKNQLEQSEVFGPKRMNYAPLIIEVINLLKNITWFFLVMEVNLWVGLTLLVFLL